MKICVDMVVVVRGLNPEQTGNLTKTIKDKAEVVSAERTLFLIPRNGKLKDVVRAVSAFLTPQLD